MIVETPLKEDSSFNPFQSTPPSDFWADPQKPSCLSCFEPSPNLPNLTSLARSLALEVTPKPAPESPLVGHGLQKPMSGTSRLEKMEPKMSVEDVYFHRQTISEW